MKRALAALLLAAGCTQSGTGVLLTVAGSAVVEQLSISATFAGRTLERTAPGSSAGPLHLPLSLLATLPDEDATVSLVVVGRLGGLAVASGAVGPLAVAAHHVERVSLTLDGSGVDLAGIDFAAAPDFAANDLAGADLSVVAADFSVLDAAVRDLALPAQDLAPAYAPSHLDRTYWSGTATVTVNNSIDTDLLQVDGASPTAGTSFTNVTIGSSTVAVLQVGKLIISGVPAGNHVRVNGTPALIITASQDIQIDGILDGSGRRDAVDGPGAFGGRTGSNGVWSTVTTTGAGGGGGGYATVGGKGGDSGDAAVLGATGGGSFNNPSLTVFKGGAPGGDGAMPPTGPCSTLAQAGGGGGVLQLSALGSLTITNAMAGIGVGGAGGRGAMTGCPANSGAGGGSGGGILLESPSLTVLNGALRATGGGGGGGGASTGNGDNASFNTDCANGGVGTNAGGPGGCSVTPNPGAGANSTAGNGAGGGGGALGYIHIRTRGAPTLSNASVTPAATVDSSL